MDTVDKNVLGKKRNYPGDIKIRSKTIEAKRILRAKDCSQQQAWHVKYKQARRPVQATGA